MTRYLLDSTALISHLRGDQAIKSWVRERFALGDGVGTSCVNVAEVARGLRPGEERETRALLDRLSFLSTTREAAKRAGVYQADLARQGRTLHTPDALVAGTARAHGAVLVTQNLDDFPMPDITVLPQPSQET